MTAPRRLSVLVVDNDPDAAESTADLFRLFGHAARFALGGEEGLALAAAAPPDVVRVDLRMPGLDGCEVARRLAARGHGRPPVLIAYTSAAGDADRARAAGFPLHLVKPVSGSTLAGLLRRLQIALN